MDAAHPVAAPRRSGGRATGPSYPGRHQPRSSRSGSDPLACESSEPQASFSARAMPSSIMSWVNVSAIAGLGWPRDANRATVMTQSADRLVLPRDLADTVAHAGLDPTLDSRALQDA